MVGCTLTQSHAVKGLSSRHNPSNDATYLCNNYFEVVIQFIVCCAYVSFAAGFHTGSPSTTEDLKHIKDREVHEGTPTIIIYLGPFDDDFVTQP
jgi:hypothetical protein